MARFTNNGNNDDTVQLYAKTSEDLTETSVILKHQTELRKHNRVHIVSFILHAIWLLVIIVLLALLVKSRDSKRTTPQTSQQVSATSKLVDHNNQHDIEKQLQALNSSLIQVSGKQQLLHASLQDEMVRMKEKYQNLNSSLQDMQQDCQYHNLESNKTLERLNQLITVSKEALNALQKQLETHELAANSSFTDLNSQQQNATNTIRGEFTAQLQTIQQGMEESVNKTLEYLDEFSNFGDFFKPTTAPVQTLPVYNQQRTIDNYLYQHGLPELTEMTTCFWFCGESDGDRTLEHLISIAVPGEDNELLVGWDRNPSLSLWVRDQHMKLLVNISVNAETLWVGWNRHCFTWKAGYKVKWYTDRITNGQLELVGIADAYSTTVRSNGSLVLLQDQDSPGGGFDVEQTIPGKLADFNMWNFEMTADQINTLTCGGVGNVASWDTLKQQGTGQVTYEDFPQCKDRVLPVYNQAHTLSHYRYQRSLPAMSQMTSCFWFNGLASDDKNGDFLISIATPHQNNELIIGWQYSGTMSIYIQNSPKAFPLSAQYDDMNTLWVGWHKHCFTFKAGGQALWYTDLATSGYVELVSTIDVSADTIRAGGFMTLLQEQDSFGGSFDITQTVPGKMAEFNMWNRQMNADELNTETCGGTGNVASWDTLLYQGSSNITYEHFPLCDTM